MLLMGLFAAASQGGLAQPATGPITGAAGGAPPVTINSCSPVTSSSGPNIGGFSIGATSSGIKIEFVNESAKTAQLVNFGVDSNDQHFVIRDVGTFSPGISIVHQYRNGSGQSFILPQFIAPHITCVVASVEFTDGSVWRRGQGASAAGAPQSLRANPASLAMSAGSEADLFMVQGHMSGAFKEIDNCAGIAAVSVAATGESAATYSVRPLAPGTCTARVIDEDGHTIGIPITVQ